MTCRCSTEVMVEICVQIIENTIGKEVPVEVTLLDEGADFNQSFTDLKEFIKMDVEEE